MEEVTLQALFPSSQKGVDSLLRGPAMEELHAEGTAVSAVHLTKGAIWSSQIGALLRRDAIDNTHLGKLVWAPISESIKGK